MSFRTWLRFLTAPESKCNPVLKQLSQKKCGLVEWIDTSRTYMSYVLCLGSEMLWLLGMKSVKGVKIDKFTILVKRFEEMRLTAFGNVVIGFPNLIFNNGAVPSFNVANPWTENN